MSALKEFANFITLNMANLAETYAQLLADGNKGYEALPVTQRTASARRLLKAVSETFETETSAPVCELFAESAGEGPQRWAKNVTPPDPLFEIECLGQTLVPVVTNLEASKFLWQVLSEVRVATPSSTPKEPSEQPSIPVAPSPLDRLSTLPPASSVTEPPIEKEDTLLSPSPAVAAEFESSVVEPPVEQEDSPSPSVSTVEVESVLPVEPPIEKEDTLLSSSRPVLPSESPDIVEVETPVLESEPQPVLMPIAVKTEADVKEEEPPETVPSEPVELAESLLAQSLSIGDNDLLIRILIDSLPDLIYVKDTQSRFLISNLANTRVVGASTPEELVGKTDMDFYPPELAARFYADEQRIIETGKPLLEQEEPGLDPDGNPCRISTTKIPFRNSQGQIAGIVGIGRNITEYTQTQAKLKENEHRLEIILNSIQAGIIIIDAETRQIVDVNPAALRMIGAPKEQVMNAVCHQFICPAEKDRCPVCDLGQVVDNAERVLLTARGKTIPILKNVVTVTLKERKYLVESFVDISEQKQAEQAIKESEENYKALINGMRDTVMVIDFDGNFVDINSAAVEVLGYSREELLSMGPVDIDSKLDADTIKNLIEKMPSDEVQVFETVHTTKNGESIPVEVHSTIVKYHGKDAILSIGRDLTDRKRVEEDILKFKLGIERSQDAFFMTKIDGTIVFTNAAFEEIYGFTPDETIGQTPRILKSGMMPAEHYKNLWETLLSGQTVAGELINKAKDGRLINIAASNNPIFNESGEIMGFLAIHRDISDRVESEQTLNKRVNELETVADVGTVISTILDTRQLLQTVVDLTKKRFDLYHAHIYLLDQTGRLLNLAAGAGEIGQQMVAEGWQISLDREQSLVAQTARMRKGVVVNNVRKNTGWLPNPLLPDTRSELAVPLLVGEQLLGVLDVQADELDHFSEEDVRTHTVLATQVAIALQNANSFEETKHVLVEAEMLAREQTVLNELGQALTANLDVQQVLEEAYQQASRLIDTTNFYIGLFDEQKYEIKIPLIVSESEIDRNITVIAADQGLAGYIVHSRTSVLLEDNVRERQEALGIKMVGEEPLSWLGVPLIFGDQVLGVMTVQSHTTPRLYDEHSRELLNAIGSQVAIALYNATLFESAAQAQQTAETRLQETIILQQLTQALAGTLVVNDVIDAFFQACRDFLEIDFSIFSLVDKMQQRVYAIDGFNVSDDHLRLANHPLDSDDIMADVIRSGQTEIITGWDPRFDADVFQIEGMETWGMRIFMPITLRDEHVGLVEVGFREKADAAVQETQVKLLKTLVDQTAIALESAQRYEASRRLAHREQTIRELTDKLRQAPTFEALTKTASEELSRILGVSHSVVKVGNRGNEIKSFSEDQKFQPKNGNS